MRTAPIACYIPDGSTSSRVSHAHHEGRQLHDDHAVRTLIIEANPAKSQTDNAAHDDGLVHSHRWVNQAG
jgi:hypothetical protein